MNDSFYIDHLPGRTIQQQDRDYLFFSGTAYLGLAQHPAFQQLVMEGMRQYGTVFGSSRNGNVRLGIYEKAEAKLALFSGAESALTVSSGMLAGQAVVNYLKIKGYSFVYGPQSHPAIWSDPGVILPILSFQEWVAQLPAQLRALPPGPVAIAVNSVDAIRSEVYDFAWVNTLATDRPITLLIDDSHGIGILENDGEGSWRQAAVPDSVTKIVTASLAKAMGLPGGVILSDVQTLASIRRTAFFGGCSPMPPACLDAYTRAGELYAQAHVRLRQNVALAERLLKPTGLFRQAPGYPVFYTQCDALYAYLLKKDILIYSFAYPTAAHPANTRIVISAFHEFDDIERLGECVKTFEREQAVTLET